MNTTQNGSYTPDWSGLNTTIRPFLTFCVTAGLIGNTLVLVLFCRLKRLKAWDNAFTINLAVGDLTNSIAAIALVFSPEFLTARIISCHSLSVMQVCRIANFVCLQEIALLRYWRVHKQGRIIKKSVFVTGLLIPWTLGIAFRSVVLGSTPDYHGVSQCVENTLQLGYIKSWPRLMLYPLLSIHYDDVIMSTMASEITSLTIVYSTVYSGADQSKHQSSASLAFVWGIHRGPVNSPHKWPVTRKMFPFDDVIIL